jgi:hypothetical protein
MPAMTGAGVHCSSVKHRIPNGAYADSSGEPVLRTALFTGLDGAL